MDGTIVKWSNNCQENCLTHLQLHLKTTTVENPEEITKLKIPVEYKDLSEVFSKVKATKLPLHWEYDWAIDLLPGIPPKGRVYPISSKEQRAMEEYIKEALAQQYIAPSTSPLSQAALLWKKRMMI